ncbi:hypothetical protein [Roseateles sp. P5_E7]
MIRTLLFALALLPGFAGAASEWRILRPGVVHGDEAPAKPGGGWLALHKAGDRWHLSNAQVHVKPAPEAAFADSLEITSSKPDTLVLLRIPGLRGRPLNFVPGLEAVQAVSSQSRDVADGPTAATAVVRIQGIDYRFMLRRRVEQPAEARRDVDGADARDLVSYPLTVSVGRHSIDLGDSGLGDYESSVTVVWMGDLDGDGRLDLVVEGSGANSGSLCLLLSRGAKRSHIFRSAGCHDTIGC